MAPPRSHRPTQPLRPVVSVIILNYNTKRLTADCLASIWESEQNVPFEVLVVDNASTDGSVAWLRRRFGRRLNLITTARNLGFGPGNNRGAQAARGDYLLFLNSDTLINPHTLSYLVDFADRHPNYGILGPTVYLKDGRTVQPASYGRLPTITRLLLRRTTVSPRLNDTRDHTDTEWVTGAALFIPTALFRAVGGFDSRFFMYFEDQDLCASVGRLGYRLAVVHAAGIIHLGGQSITSRQKRWAYYDKSQRQFFLKHAGWLATAWLLLLRWPWQLGRRLVRPAGAPAASHRPRSATKHKGAGARK